MLVQGFCVQKELGWRQNRSFAIAFQKLIAAGGIFCKPQHRIIDIAKRHDQCVVRQVIKERCGLFKKQRQIIFNAGKGNAVADVFVERCFGRIAFKHFAKLRSEVIASRLIHRKFTARQELDIADWIKAALCVDVKSANRFDFVIEQIDAIGQNRTHRE